MAQLEIQHAGLQIVIGRVGGLVFAGDPDTAYEGLLTVAGLAGRVGGAAITGVVRFTAGGGVGKALEVWTLLFHGFFLLFM